jgi:ABC-type glycerol-3-phosphate transport system substrate-binding protein
LAPVLAAFPSCALLEGPAAAVLWTDCPEFAFYAGYFNASQGKYKVETRYFESPAQKLTEPGETPDIVAAKWLKSASTRTMFKPLDKSLPKGFGAAFYPRLLALGATEGRQYLLPVNFNIPAMVFAPDLSRPHSDPFVIGMEEIKERGRAFNAVSGGVYTKMGFSLSSEDAFLFTAAALFGVSFREASPVAWDSAALEQCVSWLRAWIADANTGAQAEDDFAFKYLYEPPDKLVKAGRILYTHMDSSAFFTLPEERQANLDFRWLAAGGTIPLDESSVYYGIHGKTKASKAAEAFTVWFFNAGTQRQLMQAAKSKRLHETSFGVAGGFSSVKYVTEQIFPQFYPALLGHMPPESYLSPPNILPRNWMALKERIILPYLRDRVRSPNRDDVRPLERRVSEWGRLNREQ